MAIAAPIFDGTSRAIDTIGVVVRRLAYVDTATRNIFLELGSWRWPVAPSA